MPPISPTRAPENDPHAAAPEPAFEGDYRPAAASGTAAPQQPRLEPLQIDFLLRLADALNTTLDLKR